ncbi:MAG: DUF3592 domain-containing protein [Candidatus Omnitrophota bacterium]|nr:DUF3592 domain-containing protein [Candidatus Omnitrophota bacterium]MDZ4242243.1 DUF3592 domain-containing protein [Candidatus Omnitrophota bacterium]
MPRVIAFGFCSIFLIVGLAVMNMGFKQIQKSKLSMTWPTVEGVVSSSDMGRHRDSDRGTTYSADVTYRYVLEGTTYVSSKVRYGSLNTSNPADAQRVLNRYPVGTKVSVHFNPDDPYESVLEPGMHGGVWFFPVFGSVFALVGAGMMFAVSRADFTGLAARGGGRATFFKK